MSSVSQVFESMTASTWLKLASATVILLTFGAHDYFREQAQMSRDAASAVLVRLHTVTDNDLISDQLNSKTSLAIAGDRNPDDLPLPDQIRLFRGDQRLIEEKRLLWGIYNESRHLVEHEFDDRLSSEGGIYEKQEAQFSKIFAELHGDFDHLPLNVAEQNTLYSDLRELHSTLRSTLPTTIDIQNDMGNRLFEVKAQAETTLAFWKNFSIWLYLPGWLLGAIGIALSDYKPPVIWDGP